MFGRSLKKECDIAFTEFKKDHPEKGLDDSDFYLVGEVYNYGISTGQMYDFGDKKVNYFDDAFKSLINFNLKWNVQQMAPDSIFTLYDSILHHQLNGFSTLNYLSSHDDGQPFDKDRTKTIEAGTMLLLTPGASQIYYGDETARPLVIEGTQGDATLRSPMNWQDINASNTTKRTLTHYQKLGRFKAHHPAVGAGRHVKISQNPYTFSRSYKQGKYTDEVVVSLNVPIGKIIDVGEVFPNGSVVKDAYSGKESTVTEGKISITTDFTIVLLELKQ